jgi:hypothetical protein
VVKQIDIGLFAVHDRRENQIPRTHLTRHQTRFLISCFFCVYPQSITLHFVVLSFDRYSRDDIIGEVFCPLGQVDLSLAESQQMSLTRDIQPRSLKVTK